MHAGRKVMDVKQADAQPAIELLGVSKHFGPVAANDDITFDARFGEVHALVGENGAGKSTLMSIVAGLYKPDSGRIRIGGELVQFKSPRDAIARGIGMVYQHFMLVETMTVAENMLIGLEDQGMLLKTADVAEAVSDLSARFNLAVDPSAMVWQLSVGEQQRVEILRLLYRGARILVLDEPTAVLTPSEAQNLIATVRAMAAGGYCVIFISHKLDEVLAVSDRITVLRRGTSVGTVETRRTDRQEIARMMVGRDVTIDSPPRTSVIADVVLDVRDLTATGDRGLVAVDDVTFTVRAGKFSASRGWPGMVSANSQRS